MMEQESATALGVGIGLWLFFAWIWLTGKRERRWPLVAAFGIVCVAALGVGFAAPWLTGGGGASSLAAIAGGAVACVGIVQPWKNEGRWMLDHLVPGGIAGLSVARVGCLFDGCDFGRVTSSAPSVVHDAGTRAWELHVAEYDLAFDSSQSLAVHPFALYLAIWGAIAAGVGEWRRRRGAGPGEAAMISGLVFFVGGGMIELLREPASVRQVADGWSVIPLLYWGAALVMGALWWWFRTSRSQG